MPTTEGTAGKSEIEESTCASVHKVKVVAPFVADSGASSSQDNEEQQVVITSYSYLTVLKVG